MKKPPLIKDQIYHIYNRGVEKRNVFLEDEDYLRFIHDLFEFNDECPALNTDYYLGHTQGKFKQQENTQLYKKERKSLVDILAFSLMPNHFHLLVKGKSDDGIIKFMQKLGTGYTMFFNKKNNRVGCLFQGRFKAVLVEENSHFMYLPFYIHMNPLDLINSGGSTSLNSLNEMDFLENYRWSSFPDYIGKKNFPSVTQRDFLLDFWGGVEGYKKEAERWIIDSKNDRLDEMKGVLLD